MADPDVTITRVAPRDRLISLAWWSFAYLLPPVAVMLLMWGVFTLVRGEERCYGSLDLATPGFVCGFWPGVMLVVCAMVNAVCWALPGTLLAQAVRKHGVQPWMRWLVAAAGAATLLSFVVGLVHARLDPSADGANIIAMVFPFCFGLLIALGGSVQYASHERRVHGTAHDVIS